MPIKAPHSEMPGGGGGKKKKERKGTARQPREANPKELRKSIRSGRASARKPRTWLHNPTSGGGGIAAVKGIAKGIGRQIKRTGRAALSD